MEQKTTSIPYIPVRHTKRSYRFWLIVGLIWTLLIVGGSTILTLQNVSNNKKIKRDKERSDELGNVRKALTDYFILYNSTDRKICISVNKKEVWIISDDTDCSSGNRVTAKLSGKYNLITIDGGCTKPAQNELKFRNDTASRWLTLCTEEMIPPLIKY